MTIHGSDIHQCSSVTKMSKETLNLEDVKDLKRTFLLYKNSKNQNQKIPDQTHCSVRQTRVKLTAEVSFNISGVTFPVNFPCLHLITYSLRARTPNPFPISLSHTHTMASAAPPSATRHTLQRTHTHPWAVPPARPRGLRELKKRLRPGPVLGQQGGCALHCTALHCA